MRYKVLSGKHWKDGVAYSTGSVVESFEGLDRAFPGRFEKLAEEIPVEETQPVEEIPVEVTERPKRRRRES